MSSRCTSTDRKSPKAFHAASGRAREHRARLEVTLQVIIIVLLYFATGLGLTFLPDVVVETILGAGR